MNAAGKLAAFAVVLGGALGGGAALGAVAGPIDVDADDGDTAVHGGHETTSTSTGTSAGHTGHDTMHQEGR